MPDLHSETWWIRALDGELSSEEQAIWDQHLAFCETCRQEWQALQRVETFFRAIPLPPVPAGLNGTIQKRLAENDGQQRRIAFICGSLGLFGLIFLATFSLAPALLSFDHFAAVLMGSWDVLLRTLVRMAVEALSTWKVLLPLAIGVSGLALLLATPNGLLVTLVVLWARRRRRIPPMAE